MTNVVILKYVSYNEVLVSNLPLLLMELHEFNVSV